MPAALLLLEATLGALGFLYIFKRDRLFGTYYLFLLTYGIIPQAGYYYFSEFSELINAYFGTEVWYEATYFIILSLLCVLLAFALSWRTLIHAHPFRIVVREHRSVSAYCAFAAICASIAFQSTYLFINTGDINWYSAQDADLRPNTTLFGTFIFVFKLSVATNYILYCVVRQNNSVFGTPTIKLILFISLSLFIATAFMLGNRTDVLALSLGIAVFELHRVRITGRIIVRACLFCAIALLLMSTIEIARYSDNAGTVTLDLLPSIITKDYYAPAHILFAAVSHSLIDPLMVITSNAANALILFDYPYLQSPVTDLFNPGVATRSAGYAFYIFAEGYLFLGPLGFAYNAAIITLYLSIWKRLASTNNSEFNIFLLGLMGCMVVNLVRGQSSYFLKYLYTFVAPGAILYVSLTGQSLSIRFRRGRCFRSLGHKVIVVR